VSAWWIYFLCTHPENGHRRSGGVSDGARLAARARFFLSSVCQFLAHIISNLMFHLNYVRFIVDPHTTARDSQVSRVISSSRGA
jgi:hypothetical protein